jgi:hypothetical protein
LQQINDYFIEQPVLSAEFRKYLSGNPYING